MNFTPRRAQYRAALAGDQCIHPASVFDPLSARIAEDLGFEAGMFAGSIASYTVLGAPDLVVLTLTEFAQQIHRICRAGHLPLMVDADHGYGNALNVMRTVEELETAGVAALTIEDTALPRPFGAAAAELLPLDEGLGKIKAALAARTDPALTIAGRTGALRITGLDDTLRRVKAYQQAGADAIFLAGAATRHEVAAVAAELSVPLLLGGTTGELQDRQWLSAHGVRIALQGHLPFAAAVKAVHDTLQALRQGTPPADLRPTLATDDQMAQFTRRPTYQKWTTDYLQ